MNEHPSISGYASDRSTDNDLSGIEMEAGSLASLISSRVVSPPLSVGIFGLEGSGKSFLAHAVSRRISQISEAAKRARRNQQETPYCSNIIQIHYNAWHNAGTNPWIGLIETIFAGINQWAQEERFDTSFFLRIGTARKMVREREADIHGKQVLMEQADKSFAAAENRYEDALARLAKVTSSNKWMAVSQELGGGWGNNNERDKAGRTLGIKAISHNPEQYAKVLEDLKTLGGRAGLITNSLTTRRFVGNFLLFILFMAVAILGSYSIVMLTASTTVLKDKLDLLKNLLAVVASISALLGFFGGIFIRNQTIKAMDLLQRDGQTLSDAIRHVDQMALVETTLAQQEVDMWRKDVEVQRARLAEMTSHYILAEQALKDLQSENILPKISEYYRLQLLSGLAESQPGFVPVIREDLLDVSEMMHEIEQEHDTTGRQNKPSIERIVVIIDDLDQCLPQTAITVMQAAHLLLSFPLFAVIFVVNPLWLLKALQSRYANTVIDETDKSSSKSKSYSDIAYLSKLIQIPIWVRPVERLAAEHFVTSTIHPAATVPTSPPLTADVPTPSDAPQIDAREVSEIEFPENDWMLTPAEVDYLGRMAGFVAQSPRHVKQLMNGYRMIRSIHHKLNRSGLIGSPDTRAEFPAVLAQLTILIAAPSTAPYYFEILETTSNDPSPCTLPDLLERVSSSQKIAESGDWLMIKAILETVTNDLEDSRIVNNLRKWSMEVKLHSYNIPPTTKEI